MLIERRCKRCWVRWEGGLKADTCPACDAVNNYKILRTDEEYYDYVEPEGEEE